MSNERLWTPILLLLAGCGADVQGACEDYYDAYDACALTYAETNGLDPAEVEPAEKLCDAYADARDRASASLLSCYAQVYGAADCETADGWTQASEDARGCIP